MSVETWGQLDESAESDRKIADAINDAIAEHNNDPNSHIGAGQSLEQHRQNEVLDHPAGSVMADKTTAAELIIQGAFKSLSHWQTTGSISNDDWPGCMLYVEAGGVDTSQLFATGFSPAPFIKGTNDLLFELSAQFDFSGSGFSSWFGFNLTKDNTFNGFGFRVQSGDVTGVCHGGGTTQSTSVLTNDISEMHKYRAFYNSFDKTITFYIDGNSVATLNVNSDGWGDDANIAVGVDVGSESDGNMRVADYYFSRAF